MNEPEKEREVHSILIKVFNRLLLLVTGTLLALHIVSVYVEEWKGVYTKWGKYV